MAIAIESYSDIYKIEHSKVVQISRFWRDMKLYQKYKNILARRLNLLNTLYLIYPEIEFQAESLEGWRTKLFGFNEDFLIAMAPIIHYRILPNELVIEIDKKDELMAKKVVKALLNLGAKPFVGFSGNRGYHIHLIIGPPNKEDLDEFVHHPEVKEFTQTFYLVLLDILEVYGIDLGSVDTGVMMASAHTIRSFYSINPVGKKWKVPVFGKNYEVWYLPRELYKRVLEEMKVRREMKQLLEEVREMEYLDRKSKPKTKRIVWIEKILTNPDKIIDGRRRLIMYAIVPYLLNVKGLDPKKAMEVCIDWVTKTPDGLDSGIRSLIKSEVKSYSQCGVLPMAKDKFFDRFKDLYYLKKIIERN